MMHEMANKKAKKPNKYEKKVKLDKQVDFEESMKRLLNVKPEELKGEENKDKIVSALYAEYDGRFYSNPSKDDPNLAQLVRVLYDKTNGNIDKVVTVNIESKKCIERLWKSIKRNKRIKDLLNE